MPNSEADFTQYAAQIGILYPGHSAEDDFTRAQDLVQPPMVFKVIHTPVPEDAHRVDALRRIGSIGWEH